MAKRQRRRKRVEWVSIVDDFERSGLSQKQYAARAGVSKSSLGYWIYKIRHERDASGAAITPVEPSVDFVEVRGQSLTRSGSPPLIVRLGIATLEFDAPPSPTWLAELISETSRTWAC